MVSTLRRPHSLAAQPGTQAAQHQFLLPGQQHPSTHIVLREGTLESLGKNSKLPCSARGLFGPIHILKEIQICLLEESYLLHFSKSSDLEHLLFSAHRATPNRYKNYLQLAETEVYNFWGKPTNNSNMALFETHVSVQRVRLMLSIIHGNK